MISPFLSLPPPPPLPPFPLPSHFLLPFTSLPSPLPPFPFPPPFLRPSSPPTPLPVVPTFLHSPSPPRPFPFLSPILTLASPFPFSSLSFPFHLPLPHPSITSPPSPVCTVPCHRSVDHAVSRNTSHDMYSVVCHGSVAVLAGSPVYVQNRRRRKRAKIYAVLTTNGNRSFWFLSG